MLFFLFFFSSRRRHTRCLSDWSSDVCSSDLSGTCTWLSVIWLIQHTAIAGQICDVKKIEDLANQGQGHLFFNIKLFSQADVLRDEAVACRNFSRQHDRADDLIKWRTRPDHALRAIGISNNSRTRFNPGVKLRHQSSQSGLAETLSKQVVTVDSR